ncbi:PAL OF QUIRKY-like protein [Drosera capensis]
MKSSTATAAEETTATTTVKFLCSYDGRILPRPSDGKLRYVGGLTRVVSVPRNVSFSELMVKLEELCGGRSVLLRCQLPNEELDDVLVSVKSDDDLANVFELYDRASSSKIRAFLFAPKSSKSVSPSSSSTSLSVASSSDSSPKNSRSGRSAANSSPMNRRSEIQVAPSLTSFPVMCGNGKNDEIRYRRYYPCNLQANPATRFGHRRMLELGKSQRFEKDEFKCAESN